MLLDRCHGRLYIAAHVHPIDIYKGPAIQPGVLALDRWRAVLHIDIGHIGERNALAAGRNDGQQRQLFWRVSIVLRVAQIDRITLQPLNGLRHIHSPNGRGYYLLHISNIEAIARRLCTLNIHLDVTPTGHPFGIHRGCAGYILEDLL